MTLIIFTVAWLFGLVAGDALRQPLWAAGGVALLGLGLTRWRTERRWLLLLPVALLGLGGGMVRMELAQPGADPGHIRGWSGQRVRLEALVAEEPRWEPERQRLVIAVARVEAAGSIQPAHGLVQVELPPEPPLRRGERLLLSGSLVPPEHGRGFDYAGYLARREIWVLLQRGVVEARQPPAPGVTAWLGDFKLAARSTIMRLLPEPTASLLVGILLGIPNSISPELREAFNRTGTSHILVISGWNISILLIALLGIGRRFKWRQWTATLAGLATVVVYVLLVGATPSVVRAAVMGGLVALAAPLGRKADAWTALAAACLAMTILNPQTLWDLGFQLSALATASLFAWATPVHRRVERVLRWRWTVWMVEPLTATLAAQVWALPVILYHFGNLSLVAPLANVVMLPLVPLAMAAGAALCASGMIWRPLGLLALPAAWLPLIWLIGVARALAALPWAAVTLPPLPAWSLALAYGLTVAIWGWSQRQAGAKPALKA